MLELYASRGCGSVIVEALFTLLDVPYRRREVGIFNEAGDELRAVNPLAQVPTLVLEDGQVMTESAAIALWALEQCPGSELAPGPGDPDRARFLRWLVYMPAAIYPMYTVGDVPADWVGEEAGPRLRDATVARVLRCWEIVEHTLEPGDFLLGDQLTVLDLFAAAMTRWRPGRDRLREVAPRVVAAAERTERDPRLAELFARELG